MPVVPAFAPMRGAGQTDKLQRVLAGDFWICLRAPGEAPGVYSRIDRPLRREWVAGGIGEAIWLGAA